MLVLIETHVREPTELTGLSRAAGNWELAGLRGLSWELTELRALRP